MDHVGAANLQSLPDDQLVGGLQAGDQQAFAQLWTRFAPLIRGIAVTKCGLAIEDSEELVSDVVSEIARKIDSYDPQKATLRTWIGTIARNRAIDRYRASLSKEVEVNRSEKWWSQVHEEPYEERPLTAEEQDTRVRIKATLSQLKERERRILRLDADGHSLEEITSWLELANKGAAATALSRAKSRFRDLFESVDVPTASEPH
jgi:RNA polymerase sigma factor (sigma-70 family)